MPMTKDLLHVFEHGLKFENFQLFKLIGSSRIDHYTQATPIKLIGPWEIWIKF